MKNVERGDRQGIHGDECQSDLSRSYLGVLSFVLRQINEGKAGLDIDVNGRLLLCCAVVVGGAFFGI